MSPKMIKLSELNKMTSIQIVNAVPFPKHFVDGLNKWCDDAEYKTDTFSSTLRALKELYNWGHKSYNEVEGFDEELKRRIANMSNTELALLGIERDTQ